MKDAKIKFKWDLDLLNRLIGLSYKKVPDISLFHLRNIKKLLDMSDLSKFQNNPEVMRRIDFINRTIEARLSVKLTDKATIIDYASQDSANDKITDEIVRNVDRYESRLTKTDTDYLNKMLTDRLQYGTMIPLMEEMESICERLAADDFTSYAQAYNTITAWASNLLREGRKIESTLDDGILRFNDELIDVKIEKMIDSLGNTKNIITTGMQRLNTILNPGYRGGKLYTYAALPSNFKSGLLLKGAIDCVKYNGKTFQGKKDTHKKAVLYFTMENPLNETFERVFNMTVTKESIFKFSKDYVKEAFRCNGMIDNEDMELILAYKPNRSITTDDISDMIAELDDTGTEVCMLCFDYLKRIRPAEKALTEKEELKNVTNELKQIAINYDIPVITAAQLNRQAASVIGQAAKMRRSDALQEIDSSMIGSAWEIMENSDVVIFINMQFNPNDTKKLYLSFMCVKQRYFRPKYEDGMFHQPFEDDTFNLQDDLTLKEPLGLQTLSNSFKEITYDEIETIRNDNGTGGISRQDDLFSLEPLR